MKGKRKSSRRLGCGTDSRDRVLQAIDRAVRAAGSIFDRAADNSRSRRQPDGFGNNFRIVSKAILEIGADRQVGGRDDRRDMLHDPVAVRPCCRAGPTEKA